MEELKDFLTNKYHTRPWFISSGIASSKVVLTIRSTRLSQERAELLLLESARLGYTLIWKR